MQAVQQEKIEKLINASAILSAEEKAEWLDMLVLMNDKQASELEIILKNGSQAQVPPVQPLPSPKPQPAPLPQPRTQYVPPKPAVPAPASPAPQPRPAVQQTPRLSHISNLPSNMGRPAPAAAVPRRPPPVPLSLPTPPVPAQASVKTEPPAAILPPAAPKPVIPPTPVPPAAPKSVDMPVVKVETLADVGKLNVATVRTTAHSELLLRLQQLCKLEGYFNVLSYLEDSPAYKAYIASGKHVLSAAGTELDDRAKSDVSVMAKGEFEEFSDLLQKIQLN